MKLNIKRSDLVNALTIVKQAAGSKTLPITANVAIRSFDKHIELTCTDLDTTLRTRVDATVSDKGDTTVRVSWLADIVSSFPAGNDQAVTIEGFKEHIRVTCADSKYNLGTLPIEEFPPFNKIKDAKELTLPQAQLRSMLAMTSFCADAIDSRPILAGTLFQLNGKLTVVACDGRRLALTSASLPGSLPKVDLILPGRTVSELLRLLQNDEEKDVTIGIGEKAVQFQFGDTTLVSKLLEGTYPDYTKGVPKLDGLQPIAMSRSALLSTLKRTALIGSEAALEFSGQCLTIRAKSDTKGVYGEATESLLIPKVKTDLEFRFKTNFLVEALEALPAGDEEVLFHASKSNCPAVLTVRNKPWISVTGAIAKSESKSDKKKQKLNQ